MVKFTKADKKTLTRPHTLLLFQIRWGGRTISFADMKTKKMKVEKLAIKMLSFDTQDIMAKCQIMTSQAN